MKAQSDLEKIVSEILVFAGLQLQSLTSVQTLWAGYGHICRVRAIKQGSKAGGGAVVQSVVLKFVKPPIAQSKSSTPDEGHLRKVLSYQVEGYFYKFLAPLLPKDIAIAKCLWSRAGLSRTLPGHESFSLLLTDLRTSFPVAGEKRAELDPTQVHAALQWLAGFHGFWWREGHVEKIRNLAWVEPPLKHFKDYATTDIEQEGVWMNGGYTYLETRRKEYADLQRDTSSEWSDALCRPAHNGGLSVAEMVAAYLASSESADPYQTLVHGDVKSENLFTSQSGAAVAFFDFQYVGRGLGVCDLAKLFTCSVPVSMLVEDTMSMDDSHELRMQPGEENLLRTYLDSLRDRSAKQYTWDVFVRHWETALVDWLRFQASWGFWGNKEWLEARVRSIVKDIQWIRWLEQALGQPQR